MAQGALVAAASQGQLSHLAALHILVGTGEAGLCPERHVGTLARAKATQPLLYRLNHFYIFTCLRHVLPIQPLVTTGFLVFALKALFEVPSPQIITLHHQYAFAKQKLESSRKFPLKVAVPKKQEEHTCAVPVCHCHLWVHRRGLMLLCQRNHVLSPSVWPGARNTSPGLGRLFLCSLLKSVFPPPCQSFSSSQTCC